MIVTCYFIYGILLFLFGEESFSTSVNVTNDKTEILEHLQQLHLSIFNQTKYFEKRFKILDYKKNNRDSMLDRIQKHYLRNYSEPISLNNLDNKKNYIFGEPKKIISLISQVVVGDRGFDVNPVKAINVIAATIKGDIEQFGVSKNGDFKKGFGKEFQDIPGGKFNLVRFSPDGSLIFFSSEAGKHPYLLNKQNGDKLHGFNIDKVSAAAWISYESLLLGFSDGRIGLIHNFASSSITTPKLSVSKKMITNLKCLGDSVCFSVDSKGVVSKINLTLFTIEWVHSFASSSSTATIYGFDIWDDMLIIGGPSKTVFFFNWKTREVIYQTDPLSHTIIQLSMFRDGNNMLILTSEDLILYSFSEKKTIHKINKSCCNNADFNSIAVSWKLDYIYLATSDSKIYGIELENLSKNEETSEIQRVNIQIKQRNQPVKSKNFFVYFYLNKNNLYQLLNFLNIFFTIKC